MPTKRPRPLARRIKQLEERVTHLDDLSGELVNVQEGMRRTLKADLTINANQAGQTELPSLSVTVQIGSMQIAMEGTGKCADVVASFANEASARGLTIMLDELRASRDAENRKLDHAIGPRDTKKGN